NGWPCPPRSPWRKHRAEQTDSATQELQVLIEVGPNRASIGQNSAEPEHRIDYSSAPHGLRQRLPDQTCSCSMPACAG
ncbi:MAG: hypothetical protein M3454_12490, partial [Actinomycetota bacterium]|nr:hypothetical protein [Actinomycetota bacterium]